MHSEIIEKATVIWQYFASFHQTARSDAVIVCCSYDLRVCDYACQLIRSGWAEVLLLSGNAGNWTQQLWAEPEADVFFQRALSNGVDPEKILLERKATNTGENITFSKAMLPEINSAILISKPNSLLRVHLTANVVWPEITHYVAGPDLKFPEDVSNQVGVIGVIHELVGDIQRVQKYPELGFQADHKLPGNVLRAYRFLIRQGFTDHLITEKVKLK